MKPGRFFALLCLSAPFGCTGAQKDSDAPGSGLHESGEDTGIVTQAQLEEVHYFHDKAWKLSVLEGQILVTTQHGEEIWAWDPAVDELSEFGRDLGDAQGVLGWMDRVWVTHSVSGVEGSISVLTPPNTLSLAATATSEGELMRRPMEMCVFSEELWIADAGGDRVWKYDGNEAHVRAFATPHPPLTIAAGDSSVFVGTDWGVFESSGGAWDLVDERTASGLVAYEGEILGASARDGLFVVGKAGRTPLEGPARPGALAVLDEALYLVDEVGGSLWTLSLTP